MAKKGQKNPNAGRKWFDGKDERLILPVLFGYWSIKESDASAVVAAGISPASLSRYLTAHPEIKERKEALKAQPRIRAKQALIKSFRKRPDLALKFLQCTDEEFKSTQKIELAGSIETNDWANTALNNPELAADISKLMGKIARK